MKDLKPERVESWSEERLLAEIHRLWAAMKHYGCASWDELPAHELRAATVVRNEYARRHLQGSLF